MKEFAAAELDKCFPNAEKVNVSLNHPIFHRPFEMQGLPKIHEHDNERPQAIGYFVNGELIALLTIESDIGDGWEDPEVHNDPQEKEKPKNGCKLGTLGYRKRRVMLDFKLYPLTKAILQLLGLALAAYTLYLIRGILVYAVIALYISVLGRPVLAFLGSLPKVGNSLSASVRALLTMVFSYLLHWH